MSYALRLAAEAKRGLAALPVAVQEETLDRIDGLTIDPPGSSRSGPAFPEEVVDFVAKWENQRYYVFIVVRFDHRLKTVRVDSVGHVVRTGMA